MKTSQPAFFWKILVVALWWTSHTICTITSKKALKTDQVDQENSSNKPLLIILLVCLCQFGIGFIVVLLYTIASGGMGTRGQPNTATNTVDLQDKYLFNRAMIWVSCLNFVALGSVNTAIYFSKVSSVVIFKGLEPFFAYILVALMSSKMEVSKCDDALPASEADAKKHQQPNYRSLFIPLLLISIGAVVSLSSRGATDWLGLLIPALISNVAYPLRNFFIRNWIGSSPSPCITMFMCLHGTIFTAIPIVVILIFSQNAFASISITSSASWAILITCGIAFSTFTISSLIVLQLVGQIAHAILNTSKRIFVITIIVLAMERSGSLKFFCGLSIFSAGLFWYQYVIMPKSDGNIIMICKMRCASCVSGIARKPRITMIICCIIVSSLVYINTFPQYKYFSINSLSKKSNQDAKQNLLSGIVQTYSKFNVQTNNDYAVTMIQPNISINKTMNYQFIWTYSQPMSVLIQQNIIQLLYLAEHKSHDAIPSKLSLYCLHRIGCMDVNLKVTNESKFGNKTIVSPKIKIVKSKLKDLLINSPMEQFLSYIMQKKVMSGENYESFVQLAATVAVLWKFGGTIFHPGLNVDLLQLQINDAMSKDGFYQDKAWMLSQTNLNSLGKGISSYFSPFDFCNFPDPNHTFLAAVSHRFLSQFPSKFTPDFQWPLTIKIQDIISYIHELNDCNNALSTHKCPLIRKFEHVAAVDEKSLLRNAIGLISYDDIPQFRGVGGINIGNEIQSLGALTALPYFSTLVEQDNFRIHVDYVRNVTLILNGWWGEFKGMWPPPSNINPIFAGFHLETGSNPLAGRIKNNKIFLEQFQPIGTRDIETKIFFENKMGIKSQFAGCLTLLLRKEDYIQYMTISRDEQHRNSGRLADQDGRLIVLGDVNSELQKFLPMEIRLKAIKLSHRQGNDQRWLSFQTALNNLAILAKAKLVITQRLHMALPSVAFGVPVLFINSNYMPGGGGLNNSRTHSYLDMFHTISFDKKKLSSFEKRLNDTFDSAWWEEPTPNPNPEKLTMLKMKLSKLLQAKITKFIKNATILDD